MAVRPSALLDANVLYPAQLRDLLMRLAVAGLLRAHWTDAIHDEWTRHVRANHPDVTPTQLARTRRLMETALPSASIEDYERHLEALTLPDPDDRHVLAAAIEIGAEVIVTFNVRDFPADVLAPFEVEAVHPDAFVLGLMEENPERVVEVMRRHRAALRRPPLSPASYLATLERAGLVETVASLRAHEVEL